MRRGNAGALAETNLTSIGSDRAVASAVDLSVLIGRS
jgi:hypothetical protein